MEIDKIAHKDTEIKAALERCVRKGHVEVGLKGLVFAWFFLLKLHIIVLIMFITLLYIIIYEEYYYLIFFNFI